MNPILRRFVSMLSAMIPEPPQTAITTSEARIVSKLIDIISALVPTEARDLEEVLRRLAAWGIHAIETDENVRAQVKQKLIEFAVMVAEEYADENSQ